MAAARFERATPIAALLAVAGVAVEQAIQRP
jgi:hypothetical protein